MALVLASASPRRQELLRNARIPFLVQPSDVPEIQNPGEAPLAFAERLAREKARAIFATRRNDTVLGADTIVVVDGEVLGKPADAADSARMLRLLSGRTHQVTTSVCLIGPETGSKKPETVFEDVRSETTQVTMTQISESEVRDYAASSEPMDKAGGYAIQGVASRWVTRLEGCYFNVVGLPVPLVYRMLRERGAI